MKYLLTRRIFLTIIAVCDRIFSVNRLEQEVYHVDHTETLHALQKDIRKKKHTLSKLEYLKKRESELIVLTADLCKIMEYENADVEKLESFCALSLFYSFIGKKEEQLDKEKKEALAAAESYKLAQAEYKEVTLDIEKCERELKYIKRCEEKYAELWNETVKSAVDDNTDIAVLRKQMLDIDARINELEEAIAEGNVVFRSADTVIDRIVFYLTADYTVNRDFFDSEQDVKERAHRSLKAADNILYELPTQIARFKAELADVGIDFNGEDYPYALVRASSYVADEIVKTITGDFSSYEAIAAMKSLKADVSDIVFKLEETRDRQKRNKARIQSNINEIISL